MQVHVGPAMKIQYKDFKIKHLPDDLPLQKANDYPIPRTPTGCGRKENCQRIGNRPCTVSSEKEMVQMRFRTFTRWFQIGMNGVIAVCRWQSAWEDRRITPA